MSNVYNYVGVELYSTTTYYVRYHTRDAYRTYA